MALEVVRFADFELDRGAYQLRRKGRVVPLERIPLDLLFLLSEQPGQLFTRKQIHRRIWGENVFVDCESSINTAVRKVRRALNDDGRTPRYVIRVPGKGYRFAEGTLQPNCKPTPGGPSRRIIGRQSEQAELSALLSAALRGRGSLALISGEPGIGKSRLCAELAAEARQRGMAVMFGHCSEQKAVPYLPFVEILDSCIPRGESADRLRIALGDDGPELARLLPRLRRALPDMPLPLKLSPKQARHHLFECVCDLLGRISRAQPTLLVFEDLHWADDSTLSLFSLLAERQPVMPILVIGTHRVSKTEVSPALERTLERIIRGRFAQQIRLEGLSSDEVALMLKGLGGEAPPSAVVKEFYAETEGNPFFIEELFEHLAEEHRLYDAAGNFRSHLEIRELDVPYNVRLVLGRRLARLSDATNRFLAIAAVIGRSFTFDLLQASTGVAPEPLLDSVDEAARVGLIRSSGDCRDARTDFSHELVRLGVLGQISSARLRRLHLNVAEAIERIYADSLEDHYAELAYHFTQSANADKAVRYLALAGEQALERSAYAESHMQLRKGLEWLNRLPQSAERDVREMNIASALTRVLGITRGYADSETLEAAGRALVLAEKGGNLAELIPNLLSIWIGAFESGDYLTAATLADRILYHATREGSPTRLAVAHILHMHVCFWRGDLLGVEEHFASWSLVREAPGYGQDILTPVVAMDYASLSAWMLGHVESARERMARAIAFAKITKNPYHLAFARWFESFLYRWLREPQHAETAAAQALALCEEHGFPVLSRGSRVFIGWARAELGCSREGVVLIRQGLGMAGSGGAPALITNFLACLAEAQALDGKIADAIGTIDNTLRANSEELVFRPHILTCRGELRLKLGQSQLAQADFREAIALAQKVRAKAFELRATTSLAHWLASQGNGDEARTMLAEIYSWFTEGFDTADLKDAKALLEELST